MNFIIILKTLPKISDSEEDNLRENFFGQKQFGIPYFKPTEIDISQITDKTENLIFGFGSKFDMMSILSVLYKFDTLCNVKITLLTYFLQII